MVKRKQPRSARPGTARTARDDIQKTQAPGEAEAAARAREAEERLRLMIESVKDYAIFTVDLEGRIDSWNAGAQRVFGFAESEAMGRNGEVLFTPEDRAAGIPAAEIKSAARKGYSEDERWHIRKDGSRFFASGVMRPVRDGAGRVLRFIKVARDITGRKRDEEEAQRRKEELERKVEERTRELTASNRELEAFCYSISHDLRAPLRAIDGFSRILAKELGPGLSGGHRSLLERTRAASQQISHFTDSLLDLARLARGGLQREEVDLSGVARKIAQDLRAAQPGREVRWEIQPGLRATGDPKLLSVLLQNLLDNAWKFTGKRPEARITFGRTESRGRRVFFVRDNGAGFDMAYSDKLFGAFERLHRVDEFEGTGIGLASAHRIVQKHGGEMWAEAAVDEGATFYFFIP